MPTLGQRTVFPEWRKEQSDSRYPFADGSTLVDEDGDRILPDTFLDAVLHPIDGLPGLRITAIRIEVDELTVVIGDDLDAERCSGSIDLVDGSEHIELFDALGRPAGLLVSERDRLAVFQSWSRGEHLFGTDAAVFVASVHAPTPRGGVTGVLLDDGTLLTGDIWLVGDAGVVLRRETFQQAASCREPTRTYEVIRVDVVGDPLFRRRLCEPLDLFDTPKFIRQVRVVHADGEFTCAPNEYGELPITVNNSLAFNTALRVHPAPDGLVIEVAGEPVGMVDGPGIQR